MKSSDPMECRAHARRCAELANEAKEPRLKQTFCDLSRSWARLAVELERSQALRDEAMRTAGKRERG